MKHDRRTAILALLTGALAGLAIVAARRGLPGASRLAAKLALMPRPAAPTYGYRETDLS